jgi:Flp pilus assembly protein TadG
MRRRARRFRGDEGASAVEFGLLLPLFVMLALGTISAGFAFHTWLNVTHGAQESSRFAATLSIGAGGGSTSSWLTQVSQRALSAANLLVSATEAQPGTTACVAVVSPTNIPPLNAHMTLTTDGTGTILRSAVLTGPCPNLPTMTGDYVQTQVAKPVTFNYVFGGAEIDVAGKSVSRFEAVSLS